MSRREEANFWQLTANHLNEVLENRLEALEEAADLLARAAAGNSDGPWMQEVHLWLQTYATKH